MESSIASVKVRKLDHLGQTKLDVFGSLIVRGKSLVLGVDAVQGGIHLVDRSTGAVYVIDPKDLAEAVLSAMAQS